MKKVALVLAVVMVLLMGLTGCQGGRVGEMYTDYIQGVMDCSYRGEFEQYMKSRDCDETEAQEVYDSTAENLAYNIMYYVSVDYETVSEETIAKYVDLAKEILMKADYTVNEAEKAGDTWHLKIETKPMDFFDIIYEPGSDYVEQFNAEMDGEKEYTDAELLELEEKYAAGMLDTISPYVEKIGYGETQTKIVEIVVDDEGYGLEDEVWLELDNMVVGWE